MSHGFPMELVSGHPFHAIPAGTSRVSGTAACDATGSGTVDPQGELDVLVTCQLDLLDPRVRGTETQDRFRVLAGNVGGGDVRVADDARITTSEGTWRGRVQAGWCGAGSKHHAGLWSLLIEAPGGAACKREPRERAQIEVLACVDGQPLR